MYINYSNFTNSITDRNRQGNFTLDHENWEIMSCVALEQAKKMLLEEEIDEEINVYSEEAALQAVEKSFYEILETTEPSLPNNIPQSNGLQGNPRKTDDFLYSINGIQIQNLPMLEFERGVEEGMKFLPNINGNNLVGDVKHDSFAGRKFEEGEDEDKYCMRFKGKRRADCGDLSNLEGRKCKISVLDFRDSVSDEMFMKVLFLHGENYDKEVILLGKIMQARMKMYSKEKMNEHLVAIDLKTLLIHCSQAIAINDTRMADDLIKQIRKHSSPYGNGAQRMAHIFTNGLEARLYGTSNELYKKHVSARDILKAYHLYLLASPFIKASDYFANQTIVNAVGKASKLHIIHLGINFGLQWSCLIQALSRRKEGPPKLRITGIDIPATASWPTERIKESGRKLHEYAKRFNVPFEFKGLGKKWDEICIEDLHIEKDEVVIVNCLRRLESLGHEADVAYSPKNRLLDIIRQIKPHVFIQGIVNGSFDGDLFAPRFKHVLHHYSSRFDSLDATTPRENKQRQFIENNMWAPDILNVIACEGSDRVERPETYKQWHARNLRAGFDQLPLDYTITKELKYKVKDVYNKGFSVEEDNKWVLLGWRGKILHALSTWRPKQI
ncbi:hypothetical protein LUZ60_011679 [Juncus effusus]|nr:hypothetical protein LUZ60_011679 [Juncus effusus]